MNTPSFHRRCSNCVRSGLGQCDAYYRGKLREASQLTDWLARLEHNTNEKLDELRELEFERTFVRRQIEDVHEGQKKAKHAEMVETDHMHQRAILAESAEAKQVVDEMMSELSISQNWIEMGGAVNLPAVFPSAADNVMAFSNVPDI